MYHNIIISGESLQSPSDSQTAGPAHSGLPDMEGRQTVQYDHIPSVGQLHRTLYQFHPGKSPKSWSPILAILTSPLLLQFGIPNTFGMVSYTHKLPDNGRVKGTVKVGTLGALLEYGMDTKLSRHSTLGASVVVGIPSGITLKIKLHRASQSYVFPIYLSEEILPGAVFYATFVPLLSWYAIKYFVIDPYNERQKKKEALRQRENNATRLAERRREAEAAVSLMQETYARACEQERNRGGLIIFQALYGKLIFQDSGEVINDTSSIGTGHIIDVTVPLQCLVKDSKLILPESSKSNLPGFYDPCLGEEKSLSVRYQFRNLTHMVTISDEEQLRIPKESHLIHS
ncbi:DNAJC11 [Cordylochernes scorpioides]|uniref:DNAJC11 n=1 Tax=Cordylochernes scorpioides TaxID=51811 RepID=A0ABY6LET2_9ARAC|nr:DNAJC11 [Cordylochernes scorpioides]